MPGIFWLRRAGLIIKRLKIMTQNTESPRPPKPGAKPGPTKADKRADALRENLKKRKAQISARVDQTEKKQ
jgi:hypothetical protein